MDPTSTSSWSISDAVTKKTQRTCSQSDCDRPRYGRGLCERHYQWAKYHGELDKYGPPRIPRIGCSQARCRDAHYCRGLCRTHYSSARYHGTLHLYSVDDPAPSAPIKAPGRKRSRSKRSCSVSDCQRPYKAKGLCNVHYTIQWNRERPKTERKPRSVRICSVTGCEVKTESFGLCKRHAQQEMVHRRSPIPRPAGTPLEGCEVPGCDTLQFDHGLCRKHFRRVSSIDGLLDWDDLKATLFAQHR